MAKRFCDAQPCFGYDMPMPGLNIACKSAPDLATGIVRCGVLLLLCAVTPHGRAMQAPDGLPGASRIHPQANHAPAKKSPATAASDVAVPAKVSLQDGKLAVEANNSDLTQILRDVASKSGMIVDGLDVRPTGKDARAFGVYGPGKPNEVLAQLLADTGYNFIMVGDGARGAPSKLLLSAQKNALPSPAPASTPPPAPESEEAHQQLEPAVDTDFDNAEHTLQRLKHLHEQQNASN